MSSRRNTPSDPRPPRGVLAGSATNWTDLMGELSVEVTEGLEEGATIITGPFRVLRSLKPGDAVREEKKKKDGGPDGPSASPQG